ncbi:MAG: AraC family transcriptional regulator [Thermomicrobiales bacterium]
MLHLGSAPPIPASNKRHALADWQQRRVLNYIETHLDQDLSLSHLAGIARSQRLPLQGPLPAVARPPVHQYVIRRRVDHARALLLEGQLPLCQVALESGFAHQSHMARWMRRLLDTTPADIARSRR